MTTSFQTVEISLLEAHKNNPRRKAVADAELVESIKTAGILQPLVVAPIPELNAGGPLYRVLAGHRRLAGAKKARLKSVPCVVREDLVTEGQQVEAMLIENAHREDLTPIEEAEGFAQLQLFGYKHKDIAKATGRDPKTVSQRLRLVKLAKSTKERVHKGQMTLDDALAIAEFADDPVVTTRLEKAAKDGYNLKYLLQRHRAIRKENTEAAAEAADLRQRCVPEVEPTKDATTFDPFPDGTVTLRQSGLDGLESHTGCLVWTVVPATDYSGERVVYGCTAPESHDDQLEAEELERRCALEKEDAERAAAAAARADARTVRTGTVVDTVAGAKLPDTVLDLLRALLPALVAKLDGSGLIAYQDAMSIRDEDRWKSLGYSSGATATMQATKLAGHLEDLEQASPATLSRALAAALAAVAESNLEGSDYYRHRGNALRYLELLEQLGHDFCDIDQEIRAALRETQAVAS